ncbi:hypothetical protein GGS24DRAFT_518089 [Hypoxylon argillaceum]|nr:hypothetical protein GGS24DRAFT_518089 [Hypoxylon argillaceum]KAI1150773.1 hypothetical protein F4825DRAFT_425140 [Nemania diffusa]
MHLEARRKLPLVSDRTGLIVMTVIFTIIIITSFILRIKARKITKAGLQADDRVAFVALIFTLGLNSIFLAAAVEGVVTGHSVVVNGRPVTNGLEILTQKYKYAYQTTEKIVFGLIKLAILLLWRRLFGKAMPFIKTFNIVYYIMIFIVVAWTVAFFFETVFQCGTNWSLNWAPIFVFLTRCTASLNVLTVYGVTDILTDLIIIAMPIPLIWSLQMDNRKKVAVTAIFALGFFTTGAGVARLYFYLATSYEMADNPDFIADVTLTLLWSTIEVNIAMTVCSLPILGPIFARARDYVITLSRRSGLTRWVDITNERPDSKKDYQLSDMSRAEHGIVGTSSVDDTPRRQNEPWQNGSGTFASAGYSRTKEKPDHGSGILARTEIVTTYEQGEPDAL